MALGNSSGGPEAVPQPSSRTASVEHYRLRSPGGILDQLSQFSAS